MTTAFRKKDDQASSDAALSRSPPTLTVWCADDQCVDGSGPLACDHPRKRDFFPDHVTASTSRARVEAT